MYTDEEKVRQILINLLSNAIKFTDAGTISLSAEASGEEVTFELADTGVGIPPDALELVFHEFQQQKTEGRLPPPGTGLGLTISRQLARLLGGDIEAESTVGVGSTFRAHIPAEYKSPRASVA